MNDPAMIDHCHCEECGRPVEVPGRVAEAERVKLWGGSRESDDVIVCDDCFKTLMKGMNQ